MKLIKALQLAACTLAAHAQVVRVLTGAAQTWVAVTSETTANLTIPEGTTYDMGIAACPTAPNGGAVWSLSVTVPTVTTFAPLNMGSAVSAAQFPIVDPCPGRPKKFRVLQTSSVQVLTLAGQPFNIAALPGSTTSCTIPTAEVPNPVLPAVLTNCALPVGAVPMVGDGNTVTVMTVASPVILIYCTGPVATAMCNQPLMFGTDPIPVGINAMLGGPTGGAGAGTLYAVPQVREFTYTVTNAAGVVGAVVTVAGTGKTGA